ncbi:acyl-CoA dehydrogenase family protein [Natronolimnohabitans innermongolicus]|uniref:Acyl-CoA dehydrogenase n=1 Tax=Natronolimnohabitans innermongolicus JCM 12255 TaxID=1227499 RepID=L9WLW0_9EURY|nr:acyl-CoA dehydrogenase family protein [Natronolimnohabitans innermongolicus]ELY50449.1 acyl-CoA dehydrogenase [Natronolimnohabitans innermongolicus JCM 12255]
MIGERSLLEDDETAYLEATKRVLREEVFTGQLDRDHIESLDRNEETEDDWATYAERMGEHDLLGVSIPTEHNGGGEGIIETVLAEQAIGYEGSIVHACQTSLTQHIGRTMYEHGSDYIVENYLEPMLAGEFVVAQAFTEPGSGTDIANLETSAERDGADYVVNGEKRFIDFAPYADVLFVPVRTSGSAGDRDGLSILVVDGDTDGLDVLEPHTDWHGFRGTGASWIEFDDARVPAENVVGEPGEAWTYITNELNLEHLTISRYCLGASERALEIAIDYTAEREVNDQSLSRYQGVNHKIADLSTRLDAAYALNTRAARILDDRGMDAGRMEGAMAKQFGNELAHEIADTAMQVMGGISTTTKYPVERIQRDVRAGRYMGGATEVMQSIVQHDVYASVRDETFDGDLVGNELEGKPWRT